MVGLRLDVCTGLDPATRPERLECDPTSGRYGLAKAVNVDIDASGTVSRRAGFTRGEAGAFHSLWSDGVEAFAVCGDALCRVDRDGRAAVVRGGLTPGAPMCWLRVDDRVFYANGREKGILRDGAHEDWGGIPFPGPDVLDRYEEPPAGTLLEYFAGRVFIARDAVVYFTEGVGMYHWMDGAAGLLPPYDGEIRMLRAVDDGLYVGAESFVEFVSGFDPKEFRYRRVCGVPPAAGSDAALDGSRTPRFAGREIEGAAVVWTALDGVYLGRSGGRVERIKQFRIPSARRAAAVVTGEAYLTLLQA